MDSDYKTKTNLILPFKGIWAVGNGGRTADKNNHINADGSGPISQRFAYDFASKRVKNEGKNLEDYDSFGAQVIAPGNGIIAQVIDGNFDLPPGEMDPFIVTGNTIVIDHKNGEWSVLSHLKHNSIKVRVGEKIKQGNVLGLCGNTGNTSEPHVHYHLQDNPFLHRATGLPAQFAKIIVDGEEKINYEPIRGQKVSNP